MTQKTANIYYYAPNYHCYKEGIKSEIRLYNRDDARAHRIIAFEPSIKKVIKKLGFKWDRNNHSYYLYNPAESIIKEIAQYFITKTTDYTNGI